MRYVQAALGYLIDTRTYEIIAGSNREKPCEVAVPFYLWGFEDQDTHVTTSWGIKQTGGGLNKSDDIMRKVYTVKLNNLTVEFIDGYKNVMVKFCDAKRNNWIELDVAVRPTLVSSQAWGGNMREIMGFHFNVQMPNSEADFSYRLTESAWRSPNFRKIPHLAANEIEAIGMNELGFGISPLQYRVMYKLQELDGKTYALLCGPFAILLDDNLRFDSLVALNGVTATTLDVRRIIYSVNTYILKVVSLWR